MECLESGSPQTPAHSECAIFHSHQTSTSLLDSVCQPLLSFLKLSSVLLCHSFFLHLRYSAIAATWRLFCWALWAQLIWCCVLFSASLWQDLKPVDVTNKRSLWENKGASPTKVAIINFKPSTVIMYKYLWGDQSTRFTHQEKSKRA